MKKKEKTEIKRKTQKSKKIQEPKKFKTQKENKNKNKPRKLFFNLTLSLPLTFRVSLFLPCSLLSSSHLESFSPLFQYWLLGLRSAWHRLAWKL